MKQLTDTLRRANAGQGDDMKDTITAITMDLQSGRHEPQYTFANMTGWFAAHGGTRASYEVSPIWKGKTDSQILQRDHDRWLDRQIVDALMGVVVESQSGQDMPSWWPTIGCLAVMSARATMIVQQCPVAQQEWGYAATGDSYRERSMLGAWRGVEMHKAPAMTDAEILFLEDGALIYGGLSSVRAAYLGEEDGGPMFAWMSKELVEVDRAKVRRVRLA